MTTQSTASFPGQNRVHIGLAVSNVEASKQFYKRLFGLQPSKVRLGYAKFEPSDPSVNLSLNEVVDRLPTNPESHFGIQVKSPEQLALMRKRLLDAGLAVKDEQGVTCCYAVQDKIWVADPDGNAWEVFLVLQSDTEVRNGTEPCCAETCCDDSDIPTANASEQAACADGCQQ